MKKTGFIFLAFATILLCACTNNTGKATKADVTKDTLAYSYQEVKKWGPDSTLKDTNKCAYADIKYPLFKLNALKDTIANQIFRLFYFEPIVDTTLNDFAKRFTSGSKSQKMLPYKLKISAKVIRQDSSLLTMQISGTDTSFKKQSAIKFLNWNTRSQKPIALSELFSSNYQSKLTTIAEKIFRKEENLKDTSSLARDYFFKDAKFALNNNFLITPTGIRFLYNEREIKPVEAGTTDLFIPYAQIKPLLKPNTVLTQYIQH